MYNHYKFLFLTLVVWLSAVEGRAQESPELLLQPNISGGITGLHQSENGEYLLMEEGRVQRKCILYDNRSGIALGSLHFDLGSSGQGAGIVTLMDDGKFFISRNHTIQLCDPVAGDTFSVFKQIAFPEYIQRYSIIPWMDSVMLIATKKYQGENSTYDEVTNDGRLLIYDLRSQKILLEKDVDYEVTSILTSAEDHSIWMGNNQGEIIRSDTALQVLAQYEVFETPVFQMKFLSARKLVIIPALNEDHSFWRGKGELYFLDIQTGTTKRKALEEEDPPENVSSFFDYAPSNLINAWLVDQKNNDLIVNYGYKNIAVIDETGEVKESIALENYEVISSIVFDRDSANLLFVHGPLNAMGIQNNVSYYDLIRKTVTHAIPKYDEPVKNPDLLFFHDIRGNFHFVSRHQGAYSFSAADTLRFYSSYKTRATNLICENCHLGLSENGKELYLYTQNKMVKADFHAEELTSDTLIVRIEENYNYSTYEYELMIGMDRNYAINQTGSLDLKSVLENDESLDEIIPVGNKDFYVLNTLSYKKGNAISGIKIVSPDGEVLYNEGLVAQTFVDPFNQSSSGEYFALVKFKNARSDEVVLELFRVVDFKRVYSKRFATEYDINAFQFDLKDDIFYYLETSEEQENWQSKLIMVDLSKELFTDSVLIGNALFFDFQISMQEGLLAVDYFEHFQILDLQGDPVTAAYRTGFIDDVIYNEGIEGFGFISSREVNILKENGGRIRFMPFKNGQRALFFNNKYYWASKGVISNFGFVYKNRGYDVTNFDIFYNRPDTLLTVLHSTNTSYNELIHAALKKRSRKETELNEETFLANQPVLNLLNESALPQSTTRPSIHLMVEAIDTLHGIRSVHVIVNGSPVFGRNGLINLRQGRVELDISLSSGDNDIAIYTVNNVGFKSLEKKVRVFFDHSVPKPRLYFIPVSVSDYRDDRFDLNYAAKDGRDLQKLFTQYEDEYELRLIDSFFDKNATREKILGLKTRLLETGVDDKVILFVSGHGLLDEDYDWWFATHDMDFNMPSKRGISYAELEWLLDSIPARKKLLLLDACHSGEVDKEAMSGSDSAAHDGTKLLSQDFKGVSLASSPEIGLQNSFELMQELFVHLNRGSGAHVISAAAGNSYAYESGKFRNGVFTYAVRMGLEQGEADLNRDGKIMVSELQAYVNSKVQKLTEGAQKPTSRQGSLEFDFKLN